MSWLGSWLRKVLQQARDAVRPPRPPRVIKPVTYDAKGSGGSGSGINRVRIEWPHTVAFNCQLVVGVRWSQSGGSGPAPTRVVNWGLKNVESLGVQAIDKAELTAANGTYLEFFGLGAPPDGTDTVSVTVSRAGANISIEGCSASYHDVNSWGPRLGESGSEAGTAMSQNVTSSDFEMVVQMFATASGGIHSTNYHVPHYAGTADNIGFVMGHSPSNSNTIPLLFVGSRNAGVHYASLALRLRW